LGLETFWYNELRSLQFPHSRPDKEAKNSNAPLWSDDAHDVDSVPPDYGTGAVGGASAGWRRVWSCQPAQSVQRSRGGSSANGAVPT
jgi:hypothetical protein